MKTKTALIACALLVVSGISFAAVQDGERRTEGRQAHAGRLQRGFGLRHARPGQLQQRRQHGRELLRSLDVSEAQKEKARGVAKSLQPIAEGVRAEIRPLLQEARELARAGDRKAARELLRAEVRPILENALSRATPLVRPLIGTLSPEQRAKLESAASARGKTFDEERFTRRLVFVLARRGAR